MPTYEFRCPEGHEFEKFYRTISGAESSAACPKCGKIAERMMSAAGFAFKGSGFYLTDYGKNAHRDKGTPDGKSAPPANRDAGAELSKAESSGGESASTSSTASDSPSAGSGDAKKADSKPAESKPAAPAPKPSAGE